MASPARSNVPPPPSGKPPGFIERITEGLEAEQLWAQFKADARSTYGFYAREISVDDNQGRRHRYWETAKAFFWAVIRKLSPVRRVMFLLGIVFVLIPTISFTTGDEKSSVEFHFLGALLLIAVIVLEISDRVTMKRDLEIAREIQLWLVPSAPPVVPTLDIAFVNRPQNTVAGDYYDVLLRNDGRAVLVVADVAGKSIPAGLLMATFQASLKTLLHHTDSIAELVRGVNDYASAHSSEGRRFTTAFIAEYDPKVRALTYVNAGHDAPILLRAGGSVERLTSGGLPFGITAEAQYAAATVQLAPGDRLLVFTDGVLEAVNEAGEEYGEARLLQTAAALRSYNAGGGVSALMNELTRFTGNAHQHDDITCLLVRITE